MECFLKVPPEFYSWLLRLPKLSLGAFKLWHYLRDRCGEKTHCWPSQRTISKDTGLAIKYLPKWTAELCAIGILKTVKQGAKQHLVYTLSCAKCHTVGQMAGGSVQMSHGIVGQKTHLIDSILIENKELKSEIDFYSLTEEQRKERLAEIKRQSGLPAGR